MTILLFLSLLFTQSANDVFSRLLPATEAAQAREAVTSTANHSPFAVETIQNAAMKLVNAKVPAKEYAVILERSADAACAVQLAQASRAFAFLQIVGGFAEFYRATRSSGRIAFSQIEGAGIPLAQLVAEATKEPESYIETLAARGSLTGDTFASIVLDCFKDKYSGLAAKAKEK